MYVQTLFEGVLRLAVFGIIIIGLLAVNIYFEVNFPKVKQVIIESEKIPTGAATKILQISDFHNWHPNDRHQKLLQKIRQLNPDLIVITGDLVDRKTTSFNNVFSLAQELVQINPHTYFVRGNHELANRGTELFLIGLANCGVRVLNNEHVVWSREHLTINICGVDYSGRGRANLDKTTKSTDTELFTILLTHAPAIIKVPAITRANLVLCGHTHGGQVRLPFVGAIIAPGQGFLPEYNKGIYHIGHHTTLYIDSGLGTSTLPVRFLNRSQVSLITVTGK